MITKSAFKVLAKAKTASVDLSGTSIEDHLCEIRDGFLTTVDPYDNIVFRAKLDNVDKAWGSLQSFLSKENAGIKKFQDLQRKKLVKMADKCSKKLLRQVKGITVKRADEVEYLDAIQVLIICKYILAGDFSEAYTHMNGMDTGAREYVPEDLYDLMNEVSEYPEYK